MVAEQGRVGKIVSHLGVAVEVQFDDGERRPVRVRRKSGHVVGDLVRVVEDELLRQPRRTELRRRDGRGGVHLVAANLDLLFIVVAPRPAPPAGFLDRAIVAARAAELKPFLLCNKTDLDSAAELLQSLQQTYGALLPVLPLSTETGAGLDELRAVFGAGLCGAFVGASGVGKSSLLNALIPQSRLKTAPVSDFTGIGTHTTTVATLHPLPDGGELVDTPGFLDFGLVDQSVEEIARFFPGFEAAAAESCRFRDCRHQSEPGCAVRGLVEQGVIPKERYQAYGPLLEEAQAWQLARQRQGWR